MRSEINKKLFEAATEPKNEFDRLLAKNTELIENLGEAQAAELYLLRRRCVRLCKLVPYSCEDVSEMSELVEYKNKSAVSELENCFRTAEYLLEKERASKLK